jgi:uncharacterized protein YdbL (DUF1318 family)
MSAPRRSSEEAPSRRSLLLTAVAVALSLSSVGRPGAALAQSARLLDAPRASGAVGERFDGYAVARANVSPDLAKLIDQVNAERRAVYADRAKTTGAPTEAVGKIYAAEIRKSAPPGTWFLGEDGQWTRK